MLSMRFPPWAIGAMILGQAGFAEMVAANVRQNSGIKWSLFA